MMQPFVTAMIVPTGIGARIGGFGGDAMTPLNLIASVSDICITHPNVANAAMFQRLPDNTLYVEGYGLDRFFEGRFALRPVRQNRLGIVWDAGIPEDMLILHHNTVQAVQTVYGVSVVAMATTPEPIQTKIILDEASGSALGQVCNPAALLQAVQTVLKQGATAVALCIMMPEEPEEKHEAAEGRSETTVKTAYEAGQGVDPIGGLEAVLSHAVVSQYAVPCAHAPVFSWQQAQPVRDRLVDPRAASEYITATFLPCVLTGLARAPQFVSTHDALDGALDRAFPKTDLAISDLTITHLNALVVPGDALGSLPVLACIERKIPVLAVLENTTVMAVTPDNFGDDFGEPARIIQVRSYLEAVGVLQALKLGLSWPCS